MTSVENNDDGWLRVLRQPHQMSNLNKLWYLVNSVDILFFFLSTVRVGRIVWRLCVFPQTIVICAAILWCHWHCAVLLHNQQNFWAREWTGADAFVVSFFAVMKFENVAALWNHSVNVDIHCSRPPGVANGTAESNRVCTFLKISKLMVATEKNGHCAATINLHDNRLKQCSRVNCDKASVVVFLFASVQIIKAKTKSCLFFFAVFFFYFAAVFPLTTNQLLYFYIFSCEFLWTEIKVNCDPRQLCILSNTRATQPRHQHNANMVGSEEKIVQTNFFHDATCST